MKRWEVNEGALCLVWLVWVCVAWVPAVAVHRTNIALILLWAIPTLGPLVGIGIWGLPCWIRSPDGWLIRRRGDSTDGDL